MSNYMDDSNYHSNISRLANPSPYHLQQQQMGYKSTMIGLEPSQMMENTLYFGGQSHRPQQESPTLSDIDCSDIPASSPMTGEFQSSARSSFFLSNMEGGTDYKYEESSDQISYTAYPIHMKRSSTEIETGNLSSLQYGKHYSPNGYPSGNGNSHPLYEGRLKPFPGSAPSNIGCHGMYSSINGSDDMASVAASTQSNLTANTLMSNKYYKEPHFNEQMEGFDEFTSQANMQALMDKKRRRRESHNAVERRRRDNINDRIQELGTLLPDNVDDGVSKLNKGTILRKSVEHIRHLQKEANKYKQQVRELERVLRQMRQPS
ncbi:helix-loop-helix DNA-binding domain-containing protein [Pilobolus umbonatus]|nr:helix-loop-helix DNA-binding domain-containing protein [Pilobolus umbonatus]